MLVRERGTRLAIEREHVAEGDGGRAVEVIPDGGLSRARRVDLHRPRCDVHQAVQQVHNLAKVQAALPLDGAHILDEHLKALDSGEGVQGWGQTRRMSILRRGQNR